MSEARPTRPRWFSFSLRTLFVVVTIFAVWLWWEMKYIRERRNFLATRDRNIELDGVSDVFIHEIWDKPSAGSIPVWRRWLAVG